MITVLGSLRRTARGLTRREALRAGALSALGRRRARPTGPIPSTRRATSAGDRPSAGFLGQSYDALYTECDPTLDAGRTCAPGQPQFVRGRPRLPKAPSTGITLDRLNGRRRLLGQFDRQQRCAFGQLTSTAVRNAFDLDREPVALRDAYGRTLFGSSLLLGRRLVEAGVRFVNVTCETQTSKKPTK